MTQWTVGERSGEVKVVSSHSKLPHYKPYKNIEQMKTEGQRESATRYNNMQQRLIELGEMESK